ncbi:hypothetical protein A1O3_08805 [Capronia epimyces CBS 606.96]|uniref:Uncharacterized protein n=1 Tax=Capronia epimyces CBS 606.96 TaxID=1182542 RepID=W9XGD7_9EURO|nr:uncharacterized protein A1O3_08805 [Capronia epimyces CBS 606.96]EXJ79303.1 hypothetical protein A1O3_08805 [Capronia epimyces CBS 606.96]
MLNAFLYSGQSVMEFVNIGRGQTSGPCKKDPEAKERDGQPEQIPNEDDLMAALAESMDELTDAKTVEDALVYKALGAEA